MTVLERQRRELQRQNAQFDDFSAAITHELRNTLAIVRGYLGSVAEDIVDDSKADVESSFRKAETALDRMERVIGDLSTLAQYGQTLEGLESCDLRSVAEAALDDADVDGVGLTVEMGAIIAADRSRFTELLRNAFLFAEANGATEVTIEAGEGWLTITDDGNSLIADEMERAFEYGQAIPTAEAGMVLPNLRTLARVHGWTVESDPSYREGVRIRIEGI